MKKSEFEKGMDVYKKKTRLFPHPKVVSKKKQNVKIKSQKER